MGIRLHNINIGCQRDDIGFWRGFGSFNRRNQRGGIVYDEFSRLCRETDREEEKEAQCECEGEFVHVLTSDSVSKESQKSHEQISHNEDQKKYVRLMRGLSSIL